MAHTQPIMKRFETIMVAATTSGKKSPVWKYYILTEDKTKAVCQVCDKHIAYCGGTTNLGAHLTNVHKLDLDAESNTSTTTQTRMEFDKQLTEKKKNKLTESIVEFIALDSMPINIVEGEGFRRMLTLMAPGYTVPKQSTVSNHLTRRHTAVHELVSAHIDDATAVAFTTDTWTSIEMEAYMAVTCYFISDEWKLQGYVLETKELSVKHTGANIAQRLSEVADAYCIPNHKRVAVVHDNASNMKLCEEVLKLDPDNWGKVQGVYCSGHTLQLCINSSLKVNATLQHTLAAARNLVSHFRKSAKATAALKPKQVKWSRDIRDHELIPDVASCWNSTLMMLDRLVEQRGPISIVLSDLSVSQRDDCSLDLTEEQWTLAKDAADVLHPLLTLIELLSHQMNVSLSATVPMLSNLKKCYLSPNEGDSPAIRELKKTLVTEIDTRWELNELEPTSIYLLSVALDPRFKHLKFLDAEMKESVRTQVILLADHLHQRDTIEEDNDSEEEEDAPAAAGPPAKKKETA